MECWYFQNQSGTAIDTSKIPNSMYFINGYKMVSGIDYIQSGNYIDVINSVLFTSGNIFSLPIDSGAAYTSGTTNFYDTTTRFAAVQASYSYPAAAAIK